MAIIRAFIFMLISYSYVKPVSQIRGFRWARLCRRVESPILCVYVRVVDSEPEPSLCLLAGISNAHSIHNMIRMQESYSLVFCQSTTLSLLYNNIKLRFKRILCIALVPVSVIWNIRFFLVFAQLLLLHYMHACSFIKVESCTAMIQVQNAFLWQHKQNCKCSDILNTTELAYIRHKCAWYGTHFAT